MSTYITDRQPNKYGGPQELYRQKVETIVADTVATFRTASDEKKDLKELFHTTLAAFAAARSKIAKESNTDEAHEFGIRRDGDELFKPTTMTHLSGCYIDYNNRLRQRLQKHLHSMKHTLFRFQEKNLKIEEEECLGRKSSMELTLADDQNINDHIFDFSFENYKRICGLCDVPIPETLTKETFHSDNFRDLCHTRSIMEKFKKVSPEEYKNIKKTQTFFEMRADFPDQKKSDWIFVTCRSEVGGKMYALSQYVTWLFRDYVEDPVDDMTEHSIVTILHQDPLLIAPMLDDIATIFKEAIEWNGNNVKALQERSALFQRQFAHAMPFARGTAAIAEWFEMTIYQYHGFKVTYNKEKMINLEALITPPKEFIDTYTKASSPNGDWMIQLEPIEDTN